MIFVCEKGLGVITGQVGKTLTAFRCNLQTFYFTAAAPILCWLGRTAANFSPLHYYLSGTCGCHIFLFPPSNEQSFSQTHNNLLCAIVWV